MKNTVGLRVSALYHGNLFSVSVLLDALQLKIFKKKTVIYQNKNCFSKQRFTIAMALSDL